MKKFITLAMSLIVVFAACSMSGCKKNQPNQKDGSSIELYINNGHYFDGKTKDSVWKEIEKRAGVEFTVSGESHSGNYYTKLSPLMNTLVDAPDVVFIVPTAESMSSAFNDVWCNPKSGLIYSYDDLLKEYPAGTFPYIEKMLYASQFKNVLNNGKHYMLPNLTSANSFGIYYRTDWLIAAGYYNEVDGTKVARYPKNLDEFTDVLEKFSNIGKLAKDNGITLKQTADRTYGFSPASGPHLWMPIYHAFGVTDGWDIYGDGIDYMYSNAKYRNFLVWANSMYNKGYIYPTFNSLATNGERQLFYDGKIGVMFTNAETHVKYIMDRMTSLGVGDCVGFGPAIEGTKTYGEEGSKGFSDWGGYWGGYCISRTCKNTKGALSLLNFLLSPEGGMLRTNGIEGVHYTLKDGKVVVTQENIENRMIEGSAFISYENDDRELLPTGAYEMGSSFGRVAKWQLFEETGRLESYCDAYTLDQKYTRLVQDALDRMVLKSSKLVNFNAYPNSTVSAMTVYADTAKSYVNSVIIGLNGFSITEWDALIAKLKSSNKNVAMFASANNTCREFGFLQ